MLGDVSTTIGLSVPSRRLIEIRSGNEVIYRQEVLAPLDWSDTAVSIAASKYFRGRLGVDREDSVFWLVHRVTGTIASEAFKRGYLSMEDAITFKYKLDNMIINQRVMFNSPVWFNVGIEKNPQCSACFILKLEDNMNSITEWVSTESFIFKSGSGSGVNVSNLRSKYEFLSSGGRPSGPLSFMRVADVNANVVKSGGKTRRAAKMVVMDVNHPEIEDFIMCKVIEERKAAALLNAGFSGGIDGEAFSSVAFQNSNHSVRLTDEFMEAVFTDTTFPLKAITTGEVIKVVNAIDIFRSIAEAAWACGDPGVQFTDTINRWNTCEASGPITASNPCSEYLHIDNSACNLASFNLVKYIKDNKQIDIDRFIDDIETVTLAMDVIVSMSSYPTKKIEETVHAHREIGIGYTNLGAALIMLGYPYDSDKGRKTAAALMSLITLCSYRKSAIMAKEYGPYDAYWNNANSQLRVIKMHCDKSRELVDSMRSIASGENDRVIIDLADYISKIANTTYEYSMRYGVRNSQVSVIAPTGTISLVMDCESTGIEPLISLSSNKKLVGGGELNFIASCALEAMRDRGYSSSDIQAAMKSIRDGRGLLSSILREEDAKLLETSLGTNGELIISPSAHLKMLAEVQPFVSGGISKTVNVPNNYTVDDICNIYKDAYKMGIKCIAVYRDGSKSIQPLSAGISRSTRVARLRPPDNCKVIRHKFRVGPMDGYIHIGLYDNGKPAEIFTKISKAGGAISGLIDAYCIMLSLAFQYGIPFDVIYDKCKNITFEPNGFTGNERVHKASSIIDYIVRYIATEFNGSIIEKDIKDELDSICDICGSGMTRSGSCLTCRNCGNNTGCA